MVERSGTAIWSPEALSDLEKIWTYYERVASRPTAEKVVRDIAGIIATVEQHPFAGRARDEVRPGFRSLATKPHVIFYRVVDDVPQIIRVIDGRQDIDEIFADR